MYPIYKFNLFIILFIFNFLKLLGKNKGFEIYSDHARLGKERILLSLFPLTLCIHKINFEVTQIYHKIKG